MNLIDALECLKKPATENAGTVRVFLACGFTPLHLETFLTAHLRQLSPGSRVELSVGLFGDLIGNLERLQPENHDTLAVVIEWPDLDTRLGFRTLGGWQVEKLPDILDTVKRSLERLTLTLQKASLTIPISICLPTLPLPPLFYTGLQQVGTFELTLRRNLASFAEAISYSRHISVVSGQRLDEFSPLARRFDLRSEIKQGSPYTTLHASVVGESLAELICRHEPKKGLITDLDDTLWAGILGEVGVEGVHWHFDQHAHLHGIYQQFLASLSSSGILVGVASKNDATLVNQAFEREDLLLPKSSVFPIEAHWGRKSESVKRIIKAWNILPESVVFVDDNPMEVAEVRNAFPELECLLFPKDNYSAFLNMLSFLRNRFAKTVISNEDSLRMESIRVSSAFWDPAAADSQDDFLQQVDGKLTYVVGTSIDDARAFELVNKTNQFNLNGKRYDEVAWSRLMKDSQTCLITVAYEDKFGQLGRIAAILGRIVENRFFVEGWVMSCRAFSRRIEHHCIQYLFQKFEVDEIVFEIQVTNRNGPLIEFFQQLVDNRVESNLRLSKSAFFKKVPKSLYEIKEVIARG